MAPRNSGAEADKDPTPAEQQQAATPTPATQTSATPAGEDGKDRVLHTTGMHGDFGPVTVGEGDDARTYTITRDGTRVAGGDVAAVRECARYNRVELRSTTAK